MMSNKLGFHKVCARWVPKQLTEVHKQTHMDICQKHLDRYGNEQDNLLGQNHHWQRNLVQSLQAGKQTVEYGIETSTIALQGKVQNPTISRKTEAFSVFGLTGPSTGTLSGERHNNKQCAVQ